MTRRLIEIEMSAVQETILSIMVWHPSGLSSERLRYILEGKGIPLTPFQIRTVLQEMITLTLISRERRSRSYLYIPILQQFERN